MPSYLKDAETDIVTEQYAVVYTPRRSRNRFAENCVELADSPEAARAAAAPDDGRHAAKVLGPCRSSEGFRLFYLVEWLDS